MADTVSIQTIFSGPHNAIFSFTSLSDGTGESGVTKVNISTLTTNPEDAPPKKVSINSVWYSIYGMAVTIAFDRTPAGKALVLQGNGHLNFNLFRGVYDAGDVSTERAISCSLRQGKQAEIRTQSFLSWYGDARCLSL